MASRIPFVGDTSVLFELEGTNPKEVSELLERASRSLLVDATPPQITDDNIVKENGKVLMMTHQDALKYCKDHGGHLASTRELASFMNPRAVLEQSEYLDRVKNGKSVEGYYNVECQDEHGYKDTFYYNNDVPGGRKLSGELAKLAFWCSSIVLGNTDYAHVFYGWLGGGSPTDPYDHKRTTLHAVLMLPGVR